MEFNPRVLSILNYPTAQLGKKKQALKEQGRKIFDFGAGDPIEPTPEFIRAAVGPGVPEISQYPVVKGTPELRQAIQGYVSRRFGVELERETEILPCTGSKEAIFNLTFLFVGPGTKKNIVIGPSPGYFVMERSAIVSGAEYLPYEINEKNNYLLDLSTLPEETLKRTALVWINYPHNPTGAECDLNYLKRLIEIAKKYDIVVCSDECYVDIYFSDKLPPSVLEVTKSGVLAFHSCSKRSGMTAYRTGFIAGDKEILAKYAAFRDSLGVATPIYTQAAAAKAWSDDQHPQIRRDAFSKKRSLFLEFFKSRGLHVHPTTSTLYLWIKTPAGTSGAEYADKVLEQGIIISPGASFGKGSENYFRLALVPSLEDCKQAISLWPES